MRMAAATALALAGIAVAWYPFMSVARLQQQVLDEVPLPEGASIPIEGLPDDVIRDSEFLLAYRGVSSSIEEVEQTLLAASFERSTPEVHGDLTFRRDCCGSNGAVQVRVFEGRDGFTGLHYSTVDHDITETWLFITSLGALLILGGAEVAVSAIRWRPKSTQQGTSDQTPISAS